jgi:hypothetical protein
MQLKYSIKRAALVVGILALVSITAVAQENRSEISRHDQLKSEQGSIRELTGRAMTGKVIVQ